MGGAIGLHHLADHIAPDQEGWAEGGRQGKEGWRGRQGRVGGGEQGGDEVADALQMVLTALVLCLGIIGSGVL